MKIIEASGSRESDKEEIVVCMFKLAAIGEDRELKRVRTIEDAKALVTEDPAYVKEILTKAFKNSMRQEGGQIRMICSQHYIN